MSKNRSEDENKQIYDLCQDIRSFCFANVANHIARNKDYSKGAINAVRKTSVDSEIGLIIKSNDWEKLFINERWLVMLEEVALMNYGKKYEPVNKALIKLLKLFPKETEGRINPLFIPK